MSISIGILGVGSYLPEKNMTNADMEKIVDTTDEWIVERTGIRNRRIAAPEQATSDLSLLAAQRALADANISAEELDLIIVATASPDHAFPSTACLVQDALGASHAAAFDLSAGCSGFVYGYCVASQMLQTGIYKKALIIGAETLSRILDFTDRNTCVLFGDGAGAAVIGQVEDGYGLLGMDMGSDGSGGKHLLQPAGGSRRPASHETIEEHGHFIHMNGKEVFKFAVRVMGKTCLQSLANAGLTLEDLDLLIPHQANIRIIDSAAHRLKMSKDRMWINVDKYGNTSAACIPICLDEAVKAGRIKKGDVIQVVAFGAGLTWASAVIKWAK